MEIDDEVIQEATVKKRKRNSSVGTSSVPNQSVPSINKEDKSIQGTPSGSSKKRLLKKARKSGDVKTESQKKSSHKSSKGEGESSSIRDDGPMELTPVVSKSERIIPAKDVSKVKKKRSYEARLRRRKRVKVSIKLKKKQPAATVTAT